MVSLAFYLGLSLSVAANVPPAAAWAGKFIGEYFLGNAIDEIWDSATGKPDLQQLDQRLALFEHSLQRVDANLAASVAQLRADLNDRVTKDQVRGIVEAVLKKLEIRIKEAEERLGRIELKIDKIEEEFGVLSTVPPSPLLRTQSDAGEPVAHPLTVRWATLLCRSETARRNLERLLRTQREDSTDSTMKAARNEEAEVRKDVETLREAIDAEFAKLIGERQKFIKDFKPGDNSVRNVDDRLAAVLWLKKIAVPLADGPGKGWLPIPQHLVGPACSDILAAFELANADVTVLAPLFRQLLSVKMQPFGDPLPPLPEFEALAKKADDLLEKAADDALSARNLAATLNAKEKVWSKTHPEMGKLFAERRQQIDAIQKFHIEAEKLLGECMEKYVATARHERPTNSRMMAFRSETLSRLAAASELTAAEDWTQVADRSAAWERFQNSKLFAVEPLLAPFHAETARAAQRTWARRLRIDPRSLASASGVRAALIPPGKFQMGSPTTETDRDKDETLHPVTLTKPFLLGTTEVTQAQYEKVMGAGGNLSRFKGGDLPVEKVSWFDAVRFCNTLSERDGLSPYYRIDEGEKPDVAIIGGKGWRLPTEAEWEYACRAGTTTPFHFGSTLNGDRANCNGNYPYGTSTKGTNHEKTVAVGSNEANAFGLYDMHGNVWEWCWDWSGNYPSSEQVDPLGPTSDKDRRLRGGSWGNDPRSCRAAVRISSAPGDRFDSLGFRVARTP